MKKLLVVGTVTVLSLGLAGCGGQEDDAKTSLSASFQEEDLGGLEVKEEQADCMAGDIVDGVGVDQLKEYEILDEDAKVNEDLESAELSEEDSDTVAAALVDCIGTETIVEEQIIQEGMTEEQQDCVKETMSEESLKGLISAGFRGADSSDDAVQQLQEDMTTCLTK